MSKFLVKNENDEVMILMSPSGILPEGLSLVSPEDQLDAEKQIATANKLGQIRAKRDVMLLINDKLWLIASKKQQDTSALEADAETLRDLPELAQTELAALETVEDIQAYDCFTGLVLNGDYE